MDGDGDSIDAEPAEAWIDFLNVDGAPYDRALGHRLQGLPGDYGQALILCADAKRADALNAGLWTFDPTSFLAHGGAGDGEPGSHPIWVHVDEPPPEAFPASLLVSIDDAEPADWDRYARRWRIFDARDSVQRDIGRTRWMAWRDAGKSMAYWTFDGSEWRLERRG